MKSEERLIVLTQTCDIIKPAEQLHQLDVGLVISTTNDRVIAESRSFGSARRYLLHDDDEQTLILDFAYRTFIDKGFLVEYQADNFLLERWTIEQRRSFARWLARRYGRPVISDEDVKEILDPVRSRLRTLMEEEPDLASQINAAYPEIRYRREGGALRLFLLSIDPSPDEALSLELAALLAGALEPFHGEVTVDPTKRSYSTFTKADELTTEQIDLEWASHDEGALTGTTPPT